MSTRSNITLIKSNNTAEQIFCHWDGYPSWNGVILFLAYNTEATVNSLIRGGDVSSLGFTNHQSKLEKQFNLIDDFPAVQVTKQLKLSTEQGWKLEDKYNELIEPYTFYYSRDRREHNSMNLPYEYDTKQVEQALNQRYPYKAKFPYNKKSNSNNVITPSNFDIEYNYIFSANQDKWYVSTISNDGYFTFQPLDKVLHHLCKTKKHFSGVLDEMVQSYYDFLSHPYNPSYHDLIQLGKKIKNHIKVNA